MIEEQEMMSENLTLEQRIVAQRNQSTEAPVVQDEVKEEANVDDGIVTGEVGNTAETEATTTETVETPQVQTEVTPVVEQVQETTPVDSPFYNDTVKKIDEMLRNGIPLNKTTFEYQSLDFDAIDLNDVTNAMDVIERELRDVQNLSEEDVEHILSTEYPNLYRDIDEDDDDEVKAYKTDLIKAKMKAKQVVGNLKDYQQKILLPKAESPQAVQPTAEQLQAQRKAIEDYQKEAKQAVDSFKAFEFKVADDLALKIDVDEKSIGYAKELALNPQKQNTYFADRYIKDGKRDISAMVRDQYILDNFDNIMKEALLQQQALGKEQILKEEGIAPTLKDKGASSSASTTLTPLEQWKKAQGALNY